EPGEKLEIRNHIAIVGVQPELVEAVWRSHFRIQPDGARFGLAKLHACSRGNQRKHERMRARATQTANQIDARENITPLITAAHLQRALVTIVEHQVIKSLQ